MADAAWQFPKRSLHALGNAANRRGAIPVAAHEFHRSPCARSACETFEGSVPFGYTGRFGDVIDAVAPDGRGVRYSSDGTFIGLLERPRP